MSTEAIGVTIAPNIGLGIRHCSKRKSPITNHAKNESASNGVPKGKNPKKTARCIIDNPCRTNPTTAHPRATEVLLIEGKTRKMR